MKKTNRKKILIRLENSILKSNELSLASFSPGLTMNQMQLMMYAIYRRKLPIQPLLIK